MQIDVYIARFELDEPIRMCHRHQTVMNGEGTATRLVNSLDVNGSDDEVADCQSAADGRICTQELKQRMR